MGPSSWTVEDSGGGSAPNANTLADSLTITVNPINHAPVHVRAPAAVAVAHSSIVTAVSLGLGRPALSRAPPTKPAPALFIGSLRSPRS